MEKISGSIQEASVVFCECGCGGEIKRWKNGRISPFLRGHHTRKKGYDYYANLKEPKYCKCGCGTLIEPIANGFVNDYVKGHHLKGTELSWEYRVERSRKRWNKEPEFSPFLENTFICYNKTNNRWYACVKNKDGKTRHTLHSNAVYRHYHGDVPDGYVVHHKNGKCSELKDDHPDNLMLLLDHWNLRFFPVLAHGFGVKEKVVTDCYLEIFEEGKTEQELFVELCEKLTILTSKMRKGE